MLKETFAMSTPTLALYFLVFGLWVLSIYRDGGIGIGFRFLFPLNMTLFFLVGPALAQIYEEPVRRITDAPLEPATQLALYALLSYLVAAYWVYPIISRTRLPAARLEALLKNRTWTRNLWIAGRWMFAVGVVSLALNPVMFNMPTVRAVWSTMNGLTEAGLLFMALSALGEKQYGRIVLVFALLTGYSLVYSAIGGHIGFQFLKGLFLLCLMFLARRFAFHRVMALALVGVLAFIPYQQWLVGRPLLRSAIEGDLPISDRLTIVVGIFIDPTAALNQSEGVSALYSNRGDYSDLMAAAMEHTPANEPYANGSTLEEVFIAVIPRLFWPDKPYQLGGSSFVSRFTGIPFDDKTSVAVTYLFEFYVNFGIWGVVIGMFLLGLLFGWLERKFYGWTLRGEWYALAAVLGVWTVALEANTFAMAIMMLPPALLVAWSFTRIAAHFQNRQRPTPLKPPLVKRLQQI
jgi:hypothetical protein